MSGTNLYLTQRKKNQFALIISFLILLSIPPWPVWGIGVWNMRIVSFITLIVALNILTENNIRRNIPLAILYLFSMLYMKFGGIKGYALPTHLEFTTFLLLLALSRDFLTKTLFYFEKIIVIIFSLGIITYIINWLLPLPHFSIPPLNTLKGSNYSVYLFDLQYGAYKSGIAKRFMSIFDEPGVVGTLAAMLISYKELKFNNLRDFVITIAGLISFSLAFYIIFIVNLLYNRSLKLKYLLLTFLILFGFYSIEPEFINKVLLDRFMVENTITIVDNRATKTFEDEYDRFVNKGGKGIIFGLGPSAIENLSKQIDFNVSSYKTIIYQFGIVGSILFISFFCFATLKIAPTKRGWFFFLIFLTLAWQRPGIFNYFNLLLYLAGLSYISSTHTSIDNNQLSELNKTSSVND